MFSQWLQDFLLFLPKKIDDYNRKPRLNNSTPCGYFEWRFVYMKKSYSLSFFETLIFVLMLFGFSPCKHTILIIRLHGKKNENLKF